MAKLGFARMGLAALGGSCLCLMYGPASFGQSQYYPGSQQSFLGSGLRVAPPEPLASDDGAQLGRYGWLRSGTAPDRQESASVLLPWRGSSLGLSIDQSGGGNMDIDGPGKAGIRASAVHLQASYLLGDTWGLASHYTAAGAGTLPSSDYATPPGPLFSHESLGVSVFRTGNWLHGDRLVLTLSGPVHTGAGDLIAGEAGVGNPQQSDGYMGLRLSGRVYSTELSYFTPLSQDTGLGFSVSQRSSALRDYGAPDERMMSIRFSTRF